MTTADHGFTSLGFAKTFVLPAMLIFLVPGLSWLFFLHAQARFDAEARDSILQHIRMDQKLSNEQRVAAVEFYTNTPMSQLMTDDEFASHFDSTVRFNFATFRWMIRLSILSIAAGVTVFVTAGVCVLFSLRSPFVQYISLMAGWHILRVYSALQTIVIGIQLVALSFWVTALWMNFYSVKLILVIGLLSVVAVGAVLMAIFTRPKTDWTIEGTILDREAAPRLWQELATICDRVGVAPPDQVIAGIDDNFFVTEHPVTVNGTNIQGKTLFVSLPLLKQLNSTEADTILAHEMAHFSGEDTLYSRRITPLLMKYQAYLQALQSGIAAPVFYFMVCFRALFELSINTLSRQREFRADSIAASITSPRDSAAALLRTMAYSRFRQSVEADLFKQTEAMETADVSARIDEGFADYAIRFASDPQIGQMETAHPFDSHPPLSQRLSAVGIELDASLAQALLSSPGNGGWFRIIPDAENLEREQWQVYEDRFRQYHAQSLPYRFLPSTPEEQEVVEKAFPPISFDGKEGLLSFDFEKMQYAPWTDPLMYREIVSCTNNDGTLVIQYTRATSNSRKINLGKFVKPVQGHVLEAFQNYYGRYLSAVGYQAQVLAEKAAEAESSQDESTET